jgi:hypothetical protein
MNLTSEEWDEFRKDGLDPARAAAFRVPKGGAFMPDEGLDGYLSFLQGIQALFGPMTISREVPESRHNRL